jgi:DnaK suppressor protein
MARKTTKAVITETRYQELKAMLEALMREVHARIRDARAEHAHERNVLDEGETSDTGIQEEIAFALIQMKSETLDRIDTALRKIGEGTYGVCLECGDEIAEPRLRALPFAVRCRDCEESRELAEQGELTRERRTHSSLLSEASH